jgi:hypothetical protein
MGEKDIIEVLEEIERLHKLVEVNRMNLEQKARIAAAPVTKPIKRRRDE